MKKTTTTEGFTNGRQKIAPQLRPLYVFINALAPSPYSPRQCGKLISRRGSGPYNCVAIVVQLWAAEAKETLA